VTQAFRRRDPFAEEQVQVDALRQAEPQVRGISLGTGAPETLDEMAHALLEVIRGAAVAKGVTLPSRQGIYMAPIPADCEQCIVLFTGWNITPATGDASGTTVCRDWRWLAPMSAIITRCTPAIPPPAAGRAAKLTERAPGPLNTVAPSQLEAAARIASDDSEVFLEVINRLGEIGSDVSLVANPPSGAYQTVELNLSLVSGGSFL
jgi:hypothetical protein